MQTSSPSQSHNTGMKAVLRRRGGRNFADSDSLMLFRAFRTFLVSLIQHRTVKWRTDMMIIGAVVP